MKLGRILLAKCLFGLSLLGAGPLLANGSSLAGLYEQELQLEKTHTNIVQTGSSASALSERFAAYRPERGLDHAYLLAWLTPQKAFHEQLNKFILDQQGYFIEKAHANYEQLMTDKKIAQASFFKRHTLRSYARLAAEGYTAYRENVDLFGESKDYRRINGYVKFFRNYRKLLRGLGLVPKEERPQAAEVRRTMLRVGLGQMGIIKQVYMPSKRPSPAHHYTPLLNKESRALKKLFREMGFEVDVQGSENLPPQHYGEIPDDKTVNLYAVMHGNPFFDEAVKAHLDLPHYMIVWAVGVSGLPSFLQNTLANSSSILPVGRGHDTVEMAVQALAKKYSNNIAIHPQGAVSIFNEVMPVHSNFSAKFLSRLKAEGYHIRIVPLTSIYQPVFIAGRYFDGKGAGESTKLTIKVHQNIEPEVVDELLSLPEGAQLINHWLRSLWLENMPTNDKQLMGQLRVASVAELMGPLLPASAQ